MIKLLFLYLVTYFKEGCAYKHMNTDNILDMRLST